MKGFPTELSKEVVAEVHGYERREIDGGAVRYYIKAEKATTFADNHQEMERVFLEVFDAGTGSSDQITAAKAVYIPEENKNFTAYFAGDVNIGTRDELRVKTEQLTYKKIDETASAEEQVTFERENIRGSSFGAVVNVPAKRLELLRDVHIEALESAGSANKQATIEAGFATYDQQVEQVDLRDAVTANLITASETVDTSSDRARAFLAKNREGTREVNRIELFDNVKITVRRGEDPATAIASGHAVYTKGQQRFDLEREVRIVTMEREEPTTITAASAVFEQGNDRIVLSGDAQILQQSNLVKGDHITAVLYPNRNLKSSVVRGNGFLRQTLPDRNVEIAAPELNAYFDDAQKLTNANALGSALAVLTPANAVDYSRVTMSAPLAIRAFFKGKGQIDRMQTEGRTTIKLDAPDGKPDAANKRVTADTVRTFFDGEGKNMQRAEAVGNAELFVEPLQRRPENYNTTINALRFDCEFFPTGNNARTCTASANTKTLRVPTVPATDRGEQTLIADKLVAGFDPQTRDVERFDAIGNAKFTEKDRNALANSINFTQADEVVRLRGGEPTAWDSRARAKALEIDWNTREERSALRGKVSTTYYSQKQTGGATPFGQSEKPVYITAENGDFDHRAETATYSGNARGWQENNYVRAERFFIQQREGQFTAEGSVQSLLYNARRKENGRESNVPVYASSQRMTYNRDSRLLHYESDVDIRQGTDRIVGGTANVFLDENSEVARTDIENNVIITQPNRRAIGEYAQYVASNRSVVLRGSPARVQDAENGSSEGGELTVYLDQNRVISEGKTKRNAFGRTRSVYKVKEN